MHIFSIKITYLVASNLAMNDLSSVYWLFSLASCLKSSITEGPRVLFQGQSVGLSAAIPTIRRNNIQLPNGPLGDGYSVVPQWFSLSDKDDEFLVIVCYPNVKTGNNTVTQSSKYFQASFFSPGKPSVFLRVNSAKTVLSQSLRIAPWQASHQSCYTCWQHKLSTRIWSNKLL